VGHARRLIDTAVDRSFRRRCNHIVVIMQNAHGRTDHIVELTTVGGAKENPQREEYRQRAKRNEQIQRFHAAPWSDPPQRW